MNTIIINVTLIVYTLDLNLKLILKIINTWIWKHQKRQLENLEKCMY